MLPFLIPMMLGAALGAGKTALSKGHHGIGDYLKNAGIGAALGGAGGAGLGALGGAGSAGAMGAHSLGGAMAAEAGGMGGAAGTLGSFAAQHPIMAQMGKMGTSMLGKGGQQPPPQPAIDYGPQPIPIPGGQSPQQPQAPVQVSSMFPQNDPFRQRFGGYGGYNG